MTLKKYFLFLTAFCLLGFQSCDDLGSDQKQRDSEPVESIDDEASDTEVESKFVIPGSVQVGEMFKKAGLKYVKGIGNDPENVSKYNTKSEKLLNYGVYSADFTYSALNEQNNDATKYLNALKTLGDDLGYSEVFGDEEFINRFTEGFETEEEANAFLREVQERTDDFIDENAYASEALVIFTGAWIEGMYLGAKAADLGDREEISMRLVEQMTLLDDMLPELEALAKRIDDLQPLVNDLQQLNMYFISLPEVKEAKNVRDISIKLGDLKKIADYIFAIRSSIIE